MATQASLPTHPSIEPDINPSIPQASPHLHFPDSQMGVHQMAVRLMPHSHSPAEFMSPLIVRCGTLDQSRLILSSLFSQVEVPSTESSSCLPAVLESEVPSLVHLPQGGHAHVPCAPSPGRPIWLSLCSWSTGSRHCRSCFLVSRYLQHEGGNGCSGPLLVGWV